MRKFKINNDVIKSLYYVTPYGDVYRRRDGYKYTPTIDHKGYLRLRLPYPKAQSNDGRYSFKVHRLVAMFYLDDYSEYLQVNHKNGIKSDNRVKNLEMVTNSQNMLHAWRVLDSTERRRKLSEAKRKRKSKQSNGIIVTQQTLF